MLIWIRLNNGTVCIVDVWLKSLFILPERLLLTNYNTFRVSFNAYIVSPTWLNVSENARGENMSRRICPTLGITLAKVSHSIAMVSARSVMHKGQLNISVNRLSVPFADRAGDYVLS